MGNSVGWFGLALLASVTWGLQYALMGWLVRVMNPAAVMFWFFALGLPIYALVASRDNAVSASQFMDWRVALGMAVCVLIGAVANLSILQSFRLSSPALATMVECSYPLFTLMFCWLLFREGGRVSWQVLGGFALVAAGLAVIASARS